MKHTSAMRVLELELGRPLEQELAERYRRQTTREIARDLGLSHSTVRNWLRHFGIALRFHGQKPPDRREHGPNAAGERSPTGA